MSRNHTFWYHILFIHHRSEKESGEGDEGGGRRDENVLGSEIRWGEGFIVGGFVDLFNFIILKILNYYIIFEQKNFKSNFWIDHFNMCNFHLC